MRKFLMLAISLPLLCFGQVPDPLPNTYVNDFAHVLQPQEIKVLNDSILALEKRTSVQLALIVINNLPSGTSIEDYALNIGRKWHVGNANNGLVYVLSINDRKYRLEVASALQKDLPDISTQEITSATRPYLRAKDYNSAFNVLLTGIKQRIDPLEQRTLGDTELAKKSDTEGDEAWVFLGWVFFALFAGGGFVYLLYRRSKKKEQEEQRKTDAHIESFRQERLASMRDSIPHTHSAPPRIRNKEKTSTYIPPVIVLPIPESSSSHNNDSDTGSSDSSDYGNWGSGSSDSGSSSSGFDGGGSSGDF